MSLLPSAIRAALGALAEGRTRSDLARRSRAITATYQARGNSSESLLTDDDALAYALARMPATYAATAAALRRLAEAMPEFRPLSLLDGGCGPGAATFAAAGLYPGIAEATMLDRNGPLLAIATTLADAALACRSRIVERDLADPGPLPAADLVIASYVLAELDGAAQARLFAALWAAARGALLLVEPGTPDGFARLRTARIALIDSGAHVAAPCTHEAPCPMTGESWCRFFARVQRSRDHRQLKQADRPFEDEPYAYLAVTREKPTARAGHRIVGRVIETKAGVTLALCGPEGLGRHAVASRDRDGFRRFRRLAWGDGVESLA